MTQSTKPPRLSGAERQARLIANRKAQGITKVNGLYAPADLHARIKSEAKRIIEEFNRTAAL